MRTATKAMVKPLHEKADLTKDIASAAKKEEVAESWKAKLRILTKARN